ncbi:MAG: hypothetical protein EXR71_14405 [Myxococcales bacterium]|nr:hypothetical protein [Myxococcales bacterium]
MADPMLTPWDLFVLRHRRPLNLWIHAVSFGMFYGGPLAAVATRNPWWIVLFLASGGVGAFGHWVSRDGGVSVREATSSPWVVFYVTRMFYRIALGRYRGDIAAADARHALAARSVNGKSGSDAGG